MKLEEVKELMKNQQWKKADEIISEVAPKHPYCASFAEDIAICEMNENKFYNAVGELKELIKEVPHGVHYFYLLSRAYADIGNLRLFERNAISDM